MPLLPNSMYNTVNVKNENKKTHMIIKSKVVARKPAFITKDIPKQIIPVKHSRVCHSFHFKFVVSKVNNLLKKK